jgi:hypothetical protein
LQSYKATNTSLCVTPVYFPHFTLPLLLHLFMVVLSKSVKLSRYSSCVSGATVIILRKKSESKVKKGCPTFHPVEIPYKIII